MEQWELKCKLISQCRLRSLSDLEAAPQPDMTITPTNAKQQEGAGRYQVD